MSKTKTPTETLEAMAATSSASVKEGMDKAMSAWSEVQTFSKDNLEAWTASAQAAAKGMEALNQRTVSFSKTAIENATAAAKSMAAAKTMQELVEQQAVFAKSSIEAYMAELQRMAELFQGTSKDALKPINERVQAVVSQVSAPKG